MNNRFNPSSLDTICAALCYAMGIPSPELAADKNEQLCEYIDSVLCGAPADRIFIYNPDAIAEWVYRKYAHLLESAKANTDIEVPLCAVMPSVTPVCFGTMYTGAQPEVHGIRAYIKPIITIDTIFDAMIRNGKKPTIVSTEGDSMSKIYLGREMDYFIYDTIEQVNAKAEELIAEDRHDLIAVYNGNYDSIMHKFGPESNEALSELGANSNAFGRFSEMIAKHWHKHNTILGFAMDHGCHEIDGNCGSHGLDMEEDLNIVHLYKVAKAR